MLDPRARTVLEQRMKRRKTGNCPTPKLLRYIQIEHLLLQVVISEFEEILMNVFCFYAL